MNFFEGMTDPDLIKESLATGRQVLKQEAANEAASEKARIKLDEERIKQQRLKDSLGIGGDSDIAIRDDIAGMEMDIKNWKKILELKIK